MKPRLKPWERLHLLNSRVKWKDWHSIWIITSQGNIIKLLNYSNELNFQGRLLSCSCDLPSNQMWEKQTGWYPTNWSYPRRYSTSFMKIDFSLNCFMIQYFNVLSSRPEHSLLAATILLSESGSRFSPLWQLNKGRMVPSWTMMYFTQGVSVPQSEAALKVSYVHTKELSSHAQLYYGRRERAVTQRPFDFCFVNKWQRGEKLSSAVRGSHQIAPNMARKGCSGAAAYPPNWEETPTYPSTLPTLFHKQLPRWTAAWDSTHSSTKLFEVHFKQLQHKRKCM